MSRINKKERQTNRYFFICHFCLIITVSTYFLALFQKLPSFHDKIQINTDIFRHRPPQIDAKSHKKEKIEQIKLELLKEMLIEKKIAEKISISIYEHTKDKDLLPQLVIAVMKIESHGIHNVVSPAGAKGLMQVMPFWKKVMKMENADLFDIDTNVKMGVYVLQYYLTRYKTVERALAAYNGSLGSKRYPKKVLKVFKRIVRKGIDEI